MYILLVVHLSKCNRIFFIIYILGSGLAIVWYSFDKWWLRLLNTEFHFSVGFLMLLCTIQIHQAYNSLIAPFIY